MAYSLNKVGSIFPLHIEDGKEWWFQGQKESFSFIYVFEKMKTIKIPILLRRFGRIMRSLSIGWKVILISTLNTRHLFTGGVIVGAVIQRNGVLHEMGIVMPQSDGQYYGDYGPGEHFGPQFEEVDRWHNHYVSVRT